MEKNLIEVITLLDEDDYEGLQAVSTSSVGTIYMQEIRQMSQSLAVCQVAVAYENVSVVYTILFDEEMKLAGLYMK